MIKDFWAPNTVFHAFTYQVYESKLYVKDGKKGVMRGPKLYIPMKSRSMRSAAKFAGKGTIHMPDEVLFESAFHLARHIKGAALTAHEKQAIIGRFHKASGSAYHRVLSAMAEVLHTTPERIRKEAEAIDDVRRLMQQTKRKAREWESNVSTHLGDQEKESEKLF
jgi:hypothetical protein